jgi:hypothetical protein
MSDQGRYRKIYARVWQHPGFNALSEGEKVLALYVLTGPQTNRLGLYLFSIATAAEDLGTVPETLKKRFVNVCQTFGWLFDAKARVIYIPSWFKWNPPENVNVMKGSLKDLNEIPPCGLVDAFAHNIETLPVTLHETFVEGLRQRLPKGMSTQEQYPEPYQNQEPRSAALRAVAFKEKDNGHPPNIDTRLVRIAKDVLREAPRQSDTSYLVDVFLDSCRRQQLDVTRATAILALGANQ